MKVLNAGYKIITNDYNDKNHILKKIEDVSTIYSQDEHEVTDKYCAAYVKHLIKRKQKQAFSHAMITFELDELGYERLMNAVTSLRELQVDYPEEYSIFTNHLIYTKYYDGYEVHCYVTGSLSAWITEIQTLYNFLNCIPFDICKAIYELTDGIIDICNDCNSTDSTVNLSGIMTQVVTDYSTMPKWHRMHHEFITVRFDVDRNINNDLSNKDDLITIQQNLYWPQKELTVIKPSYLENGTIGYMKWEEACKAAEAAYLSLVEGGAEERLVNIILPLSTKSSFGITSNLMDWHYTFNRMACQFNGHVHPQIEEVMIPCLKELKENLGYGFAFDDLKTTE